MTLEIGIVLAVIALAVVLFATEWLSIDAVSILVMLIFMVSGILTPKEGFSGFSNPATLTIAAMFVLSEAVFKTGALNKVGELLSWAGQHGYFTLLAVMMVSAALMSAFINDTAVVALLIPVVLEVGAKHEINASRLLMPLSFGALMGGVCTLIGTSTNILVSGIAESRDIQPFGMFELTQAGVFFLIAGLAYMLLLGRRLLPNREEGESLEEIYRMGTYLSEVKIPEGSSAIGKPIDNMPVFRELDIEVVSIKKPDGTQVRVHDDIRVEAGDMLTVRTDKDELRSLVLREQYELQPQRSLSEKMENFSIFEALVAPTSDFIGKTLAEVHFKSIHEGASVLGIRSREELINENIEDAQLQSGDILLVKAIADQMREFHESENLLVLSKVEEDLASAKPDKGKIALTLFILAGVVLTAALDLAPILLTASTGVMLMVILNIISLPNAYKAIDWKVIFMLAGVLSMGTALEKTGADQLLADFITQHLAAFGPRIVLSLVFFLTFITSNIMSNNATAALMAPIAITVAANLEVSNRPFLMAVTYAASLSFMTPMGYQTNMMIYTPGNYRFRDYLRVGAPLNLLYWILASLILPWVFSF